MKRNNARLEILIPFGSFVLKGSPLARISNDIEKRTIELILSNFIFFEEEIVEENYYLGFKQITETAVKALSPGINDPGTAIKAIDYLTDLISYKFSLREKRLLYSENKPRILLRTPSNGTLIYYCFAPIRQYGKQDIVLILKLFDALREILLSTKPNFEEIIFNEAKILVEDAAKYLNNSADRGRVNDIIELFNKSGKKGNVLKVLPVNVD